MSPRILPPTALLIALILMAVLHVAFPIWSAGATLLRLLGLVPVILGVLLAGWGSRLFDRAGTTVRPGDLSSRLVTEGPYRFTRNPMYLGMILLLVGVWGLLGSAGPGVIIPLFGLWLTRRVIHLEESMLTEAFGEEYEAYRRRVRRWL